MQVPVCENALSAYLYVCTYVVKLHSHASRNNENNFGFDL